MTVNLRGQLSLAQVTECCWRQARVVRLGAVGQQASTAAAASGRVWVMPAAATHWGWRRSARQLRVGTLEACFLHGYRAKFRHRRARGSDSCATGRCVRTSLRLSWWPPRWVHRLVKWRAVCVRRLRRISRRLRQLAKHAAESTVGRGLLRPVAAWPWR